MANVFPELGTEFLVRSEARDFAARELPVGEPVVVRFNTTKSGLE